MLNSTPVTECTTNSPAAFDSKINNWAEGVLLTIDADLSKLTIRGAKQPYASEYAKMLKRIHDKTEKLLPVDGARQESEIRLEWRPALGKARGMEVQKDSDMTFQLPGTDGKLVIVDETPFYNCDKQSARPDASLAGLTDQERKAVHALKDLKIGDCVVVGYANGVLNDTAYAVLKANKQLEK
jgi:hypothetical protein